MRDAAAGLRNARRSARVCGLRWSAIDACPLRALRTGICSPVSAPLSGEAAKGRPCAPVRASRLVVAAAAADPLAPRSSSSSFKVRLIQPEAVSDADACDRLLLYIPGSDGTGQAILPQIAGLRALGYDVWCLYIPAEDRSDWEQLTTQLTLLLRQLLVQWRANHPAARSGGGGSSSTTSTSTSSNGASNEAAVPGPRVTIVAESFGCCLALRLAASGAGPELLDRMVLVNPATSFKASLGGLSSLIAATNLLSLFPKDWYSVAQATLLPLLVDADRVDEDNRQLLQSMIQMLPPRCHQSFGFTATARRPGSISITSAAGSGASPNGSNGNGSSSSSSSNGNGSSSDRRSGASAAAAAAAALWKEDGRLAPSGAGSSGSGGELSGYDSPGAAGAGIDLYGAADRRGTLFYSPAAAANFRTNLLRTGDPGEEALRRIRTPVLLITSARDKLLPSIAEGARLERLLPHARRHILPDSCHAALLERGADLAALLRATGFDGPVVQPPPRAAAAGGARGGIRGTAAAGASRSGSALRRRQQAPQGEGAAGAAASSSGVGAGAGGTAAGGPAPAASLPGSTELRGDAAAAFAAIETRAAAAAAAAAATSRPEAPLAQAALSGASSSSNGNGNGNGSANGNGAGSVGSNINISFRIRKDDSNGNGKGKGSEKEAGKGGDAEAGGVADTDSAFDEWCQTLTPWRELVSPVVFGFEHLPPPSSPDFSRPMLFVGNHQKMGFYDTPLLVYELYVRGYRVRGLAHPGHWAGPVGKWFESFGAVKASPMAAYRLLRSNEKVLLFPGGAKEVVKKRGQEYRLLWKEAPDFVRLAARCGALIVPFAAVGADDAYDVVMDTDEVVAHPVLGPLTKGIVSRLSSALDPRESIFPITRLPVVGLPTLIPVPNLQRLYFKFAPPVDPQGTDINDPQQVQELYDGVKNTVTEAMAELLTLREADEESQLGPRLQRALQRMVPKLGAEEELSPPA